MSSRCLTGSRLSGFRIWIRNLRLAVIRKESAAGDGMRRANAEVWDFARLTTRALRRDCYAVACSAN